MKMNLKTWAFAAVIATAGAAFALTTTATEIVSGDIVTSTTWTADKVYDLDGQIYVRDGATLTIEAGTRIENTAGNGSSLAVSQGAKIYVNGTEEAPVVMTSSNDNGTARVACNEWGNLTIMGKGLIAASSDSERTRSGNTKTPTGLNTVQMEGLVDDGVNGVIYGGNDDNDDSGSISYLSIRYGGKVLAADNELNGLSLGGIGRETDIDHVEIYNNVDDGIEIWGGAVNLKYVSIWNVGDDSFDIDQGWRGKAQFGLIVQGYSAEAKQGSGWGDNCFEHDGAEDSDASPATSAKIANFTVVGQPASGDGATTWRDNARVQYSNMIFAQIGEELVRFDGNDGDGAQGYNYALNGVAYTDDESADWSIEQGAFAGLWSEVYTNYYADNFVTDVYATVAEMYPAHTSGYLCEIRNSVMFFNASDSDDMADTVGVFAPIMNNTVATDAPFVDLQRADLVTYVDSKNKTAKLYPVTFIDPRAANDAVNAGGTVEGDNFFVEAPFAGGFSANYNWIEGWTAAAEFGLTTVDTNPEAPAATVQMTASTLFSTVEGEIYNVQESSDMETWATVATIVGNGSTMSATDLDVFDSAKFYRVAQ